MKEIGWDSSVKEDPIQVVGAEDGSGVGAALIAALTVKVMLHRKSSFTY